VPITWPHIEATFKVLVAKLKKVPPGLRIAVIDYWIGRLYLERSKVEFQLAEISEADVRRYGGR
jgi:hypothetical protein